MARLADLPGDVRVDDQTLPQFGSDLAAQNTAGFRSLDALLSGGLTSANLDLEVKTVRLSHGVATEVGLGKLFRARGAYALSVGSTDGKTRHSLARPLEILGSSRSRSVRVQAAFLDPRAQNVPVTVLFHPDGNSSTLPVSAEANGLQGFGGTGAASQGSFVVIQGSNLWTDIPNMSTSYIALSTTRQLLITWTFSAFSQGPAGANQTRVVINNVPSGPFNFYWNSGAMHLSWSFQSLSLNPGLPIGTVVPVKIQVQSPTGSNAEFEQDLNDTCSVVVLEVG